MNLSRKYSCNIFFLHKSKKMFSNFKESVKLKMNTKLKLVKSINFLEQCFFRLLLANDSLLAKKQWSIMKILKYRKPWTERGIEVEGERFFFIDGESKKRNSSGSRDAEILYNSISQSFVR